MKFDRTRAHQYGTSYFEFVFKIADYIFKFITWTILVAGVEYVRVKFEIGDLRFLSLAMFILLGFPGGALTVLTTAWLCKPIKDNRIYIAMMIVVQITMVILVILLQIKLNHIAREIAEHR